MGAQVIAHNAGIVPTSLPPKSVAHPNLAVFAFLSTEMAAPSP